jgi:RNA polymerase sigma-70 factor (TIGR02943 family)
MRKMADGFGKPNEPTCRPNAKEAASMADAGETKRLDPMHWVDAHGDYLFRYARSRLRDPEASEEVVQETFVAGLKGAGQYAGRGSERAWLLGILKRKIIDQVRRRSRAAVGGESETGDDLTELLFDNKGHWKNDPRIFGENPAAALESMDFYRLLQSCLDSLPQGQADAFTLREVEGEKSKEVCKVLGITSSNLWVLLHRARLKLAACMRKKLAT